MILNILKALLLVLKQHVFSVGKSDFQLLVDFAFAINYQTFRSNLEILYSSLNNAGVKSLTMSCSDWSVCMVQNVTDHCR